MEKDLAVIGAGASGLAAAIEYKRTFPDGKAIVIEKLPRIGKKILVTGNGRCNLSNRTINPADYNHPNFVKYILEKYDINSTLRFFQSIGLLTVTDNEGRIYPMSNTAASVLDALRFECESAGIEFLCDTAVTNIKKSADFFIINNCISAKKVILCTGGKSAKAHGSDGSGYALLRQLGHTVTSVSPALVQITTDPQYPRQLKGIRAHCKLSLSDKNTLLGTSAGEILFTDYGLSGIAVMDISRYLRNSDFSHTSLSLDLSPALNEKELAAYIKDRIVHTGHLLCENLLTGLLPKRLGQILLKYAYVEPNKKMTLLTQQEILQIISALKTFKLRVTGTKGFESSQVTAGGADLNEFDPRTLQSEKIKGLYCCGELLDVDGHCGGYNLQWAWSSGRTAGTVSER